MAKKELVRLAAAAAVATALIIVCLMPGLSGGFILDDFENFSALSRFLDGELRWDGAVFGNQSGPMGRPLAMASFALDATMFGMDPRAFLRTNLVLHIACAALVFVLTYRLLMPANVEGRRRLLWFALAIAFVWAVLPIHVSVVLYAVQRMALLSAFFLFAALVAYVIGRQKLQEGRPGWRVLLFIAFPALTMLAVLSKENGALAPLLAAGIEVAWFLQTRRKEEARMRAVFFGVFLAFPALLAVAALVYSPDRFFGAYETRSFTLLERLLTQPRVLWDYVRQILLPFGPGMGLIHDDYPKSTSLLGPPTTFFAIGGWFAALMLAWRMRAGFPKIIGGLLLFLAAHAMESTVLPLELYFEHRNYIASLGVLIAVVGIGELVASRFGDTTAAFRLALGTAAIALPLAFAGATFARASVWGNPGARMAQSLQTSPHSPRLRSQLAVAAAQSGDLEQALNHIHEASLAPTAPPPRTLDLWRVLAACLSGKSLQPENILDRLSEGGDLAISLSEMVAFEALATRIETGACRWPSPQEALAIGEAMLTGTQQRATTHQVWRTRYGIARLQASQAKFDVAVETASDAWRDSGWNPGVGVLVFQLHASRSDLRACEETLDRLRANASPRDLALQRTIAQFDEFVNRESALDPRPDLSTAP